MAIYWSEDLATGVQIIDDQHKELFSRINALLDACSVGRGKEEVGKVLQFLEEYVASHFSEEETRMQQYGYPGQAYHKSQHDEFRANFADLKKTFDAEGPGVFIVIKTNRVVVDWLSAHIRRVDKALGAFLKDKGGAAPA